MLSTLMMILPIGQTSTCRRQSSANESRSVQAQVSAASAPGSTYSELAANDPLVLPHFDRIWILHNIEVLLSVPVRRFGS
jgi:hypothetical protein